VSVVDSRSSGELVYAVGDVRLVLPTKAKHFKRLVRCAFCQAEFVSRSVLSRSELELGNSQFLCQQCSGPDPDRPGRGPGGSGSAEES
jgi:hypothetical protein